MLQQCHRYGPVLLAAATWPSPPASAVQCPVQIQGGAWCGEEALRSAEAINFEVEPGDVIVLGERTAKYLAGLRGSAGSAAGATVRQAAQGPGAHRHSVLGQAADVLLLFLSASSSGSDGLWDNVYLHDLGAIVRAHFAAVEAEAAAAASAAAARRGRARASPGGVDVPILPSASLGPPPGLAGCAEGAAAAATAASAASGPEPAAAAAYGGSNDASSTRSCQSAISARSSSSSSLSSSGGGCASQDPPAPAPVWPTAQGIAEALALTAKTNSTDPQFVSPFGLVDRAIR